MLRVEQTFHTDVLINKKYNCFQNLNTIENLQTKLQHGRKSLFLKLVFCDTGCFVIFVGVFVCVCCMCVKLEFFQLKAINSITLPLLSS